MLRSIVAIALAGTILGVACAPTPPNPLESEGSSIRPKPSEANDSEKIEVLNIAVIPWQSSGKHEAKIEILADYLQEALKVPVNIQITKDYDTSVDLLVEEKVQMAYLGPFTYVKAKERNPQLEPIVAHIEKSTGRPWYSSTIVVQTDSGINKVEDLKDKRFGFVSQSSTSGYLVPSGEFKKIGLVAERDFAAIAYAGSHDKNTAALVAGKVDAIAIDKATLDRARDSGLLPPEGYKVIWESDPIPNSPIVISSRLSSQFKFALKKALIDAPSVVVDVSGSQSDGYTLVGDEDYEIIRQLQELMKLDSK
ncbi:MAG: phosphate/phosphite/phosphonate ABC transporter substrate-binding protein [Oscillatoria sp. SIO1A7]|nr:phosphate/phosphite/phosphonate ABC transporter substrate-binding protein [Oscillatoria sp. SIO1A7]